MGSPHSHAPISDLQVIVQHKGFLVRHFVELSLQIARNFLCTMIQAYGAKRCYGRCCKPEERWRLILLSVLNTLIFFTAGFENLVIHQINI